MNEIIYTYQFCFDKTKSEIPFLNDVLLGHSVLEFTENDFLKFRHDCESIGLRVCEITRYIPDIVN